MPNLYAQCEMESGNVTSLVGLESGNEANLVGFKPLLPSVINRFHYANLYLNT